MALNLRHKFPALGRPWRRKCLENSRKGDVLFAHPVQNADGADLFIGKANDLAARAAELSLERLDAPGRRVEMLLEEFLRTFMNIISSRSVLANPQNQLLFNIADSR